MNAASVAQHFSHRFTIPAWIWWCAAAIALLLDLVGNLVSVVSIPRLGQDYYVAGLMMMAAMGFYLVLLCAKVFMVLRRHKHAYKDLKRYLRWTTVQAIYLVLCLVGLFMVVLQIPAAAQQADSFWGSLSGGAHRYGVLMTDAFLTTLSGLLWGLNLATVPRLGSDNPRGGETGAGTGCS